MKKTYVTLIMIIILLSLLAACANDAGIRPDTSLPQQTEPKPMPKGWPVVYASILEEYKTLAGYIYQDADSLLDILESDVAEEWEEQNIPVLSEEGDHWGIFIGGVYLREDKDAYGYALKDLNGDGSDELILLLKDYKILAVYSTADGKPRLVDQYWDRYSCDAIDESGLLYIYGFDASDDWSFGIYKLSDEGSKLFLKAEYGKSTDNLKRVEDPYYYKVIDEEREIISKAEFDKLYDDWIKATKIANSGITFIPILNRDDSGGGTGMFVPAAATPAEAADIKESKKPRPGSAALIDRNRELYTLFSGENYIVYRFYNNDDEKDFFYYRIEVYKDDGKMIFEDEFDWPEPIIAYVSKDVIQIDIHTGTGASNVRYCDVKRGLVSEVFDIQEPILFVDGILIQGKRPALTLSAENVFDKTAYCKEYLVDPAKSILINLRLIDEQTIKIEYVRCIDEDGSLDKEYTKTIPLSQLQ